MSPRSPLHLIHSLPGAILLIAVVVTGCGRSHDALHYGDEDFQGVEKIDVHAHIYTESPDFVRLAQNDGFLLVNMAVWTGTAEENREDHRLVHFQRDMFPDRVVAVCSFPIENFNDEDYAAQTIAYLEDQFAKGARGVKVWKNIGMELRDGDGNFVMIDHPKFAPIFRFIAENDVVLLGHLGEPKNCWLPLDEMTVEGDRSYFEENPKYHMYLHPEMPSYEDQMVARDKMLEQHPDLRFLGCHLGSLEWSVERMTAFLDRFPRASIGLAARMPHLQVLSNADHDEVVTFFNTFPDRIVYGTDTGLDETSNPSSVLENAQAVWRRDWSYLCTDQWVNVPDLGTSVRGLNLPRQLVDQIYSQNARRLFPRGW